MRDKAEETVHYLNTDLLLVAPVEMGLLVAALTQERSEAAGVSCLYKGHGEGTDYRANFEAFGAEGGYDTPEKSIKALLDAIEQLPQALQPLWQACTKKTLDIGYNSGVTPRSVSHPIPTDTLLRMQSLGIDLCITVYSVGE